MSLESMLDEDTVTIKSQTVTKDTSGGPVRTRTADATASARVQSLGAVQQIQFGGFVVEADYVVYTQYTPIVNGDLLVTSDGVNLRVTGAKKVRAMGGIDTFYPVYCMEVRLT